jgi:hypothetical protein
MTHTERAVHVDGDIEAVHTEPVQNDGSLAASFIAVSIPLRHAVSVVQADFMLKGSVGGTRLCGSIGRHLNEHSRSEISDAEHHHQKDRREDRGFDCRSAACTKEKAFHRSHWLPHSDRTGGHDADDTEGLPPTPVRHPFVILAFPLMSISCAIIAAQGVGLKVT